jgi:CHAD domain-containing protein
MHGRHSNNSRRKRLSVIDSAAVDKRHAMAVPPHLATVSWIDHESVTARTAFRDLSRELKSMSKKPSEARVHRARVALRRWSSIWKLMRIDGWESDRFYHQIGKPLKKLQKLLGACRDCDVNIEQAQRLGCTKKLINRFKAERSRNQDKLEKYLKDIDITKILSSLRTYLQTRGGKIRAKLPAAKAEQCAFNHIELFLSEQESVTREQAQTAHTPEEFHELRLSIKRWRYLLTEFFGLTNLELVRAQQILGQMHDLDRLTPILLEDLSQAAALQTLKVRHQELQKEIESMRARLPYGLRPQVTSAEPAGASHSAR